jgi:hypothetical protein
VRWNPGPPLRELRNEYASVAEPILARRPCSTATSINPGQAFTLGLVRPSSLPPS